MNLGELGKHWNEFGKTDPLWAVLAVPGTENSRWDVDRFFESGRLEIDHVLHQVEQAGITVARRRALDFGCGVGRLTQGMCQHFEQCCGVDIAPSMIELANQYNQFSDKCQYYLNKANNLALFEDNSFAFIYSVIVLQHMQPKYSRHYIREFMRVLEPHGVLVFQVPTGSLRHARQSPEEQPLGPQTACTARLPRRALRARIVPQVQSIRCDAGVQKTIHVKVHNLSPIVWPALGSSGTRHQVLLANIWRDQRGKLVTKDDGRAPLPHDLGPDEHADLALPVTAPSSPGTYVLDFDMVQEHVTWFRKRGSCSSTTVQADVRPVEGRPGPGAIVPRMEMHGIPKDEVLGILRQCGGELFQIRDDPASGPNLESFTYFVRKEALPDKQVRSRLLTKGLALFRTIAGAFTIEDK
jgi:SAM-dependent methyltransferase